MIAEAYTTLEIYLNSLETGIFEKTCRECGTTFETVNQKQRHEKSSEKFPCFPEDFIHPEDSGWQKVSEKSEETEKLATQVRSHTPSQEDRTCKKCGAQFQYPALLARHLNRKTPCAPIITDEEVLRDLENKHQCKHCKRAFLSRTSMLRHVRQVCKAAAPNKEEVTAKKKSQYRALEELQAQMDARQKEIDELKALSA